ncbi:hypothetical protein Glove_343g26 [Diversispora epigaea]|uniref:Uncharacterized protein n=1 Tax=Diversispora epigaea TaxID=1348612 RepID=A0A397HKN6_9GLOM|nr:hypothetical protein Glove_343g26 [Diversispora epigaea]
MEIYEKNSDFYSETQNIYSNEFKENINELEEELTEFEEGLNEFEEESNESEEESNESEKELNEQVYEFPELELFEYNKENYVKALMALEKETIEQFSDKSENLEEQFNDESENLEIDFEIQVSQEILSNQKPVEEELVEEESNESEEESNESEKELNEQVYEFPELELFEYNKENYVKALMALEKETIEQFSDKSENLEEQFNDESENLEIDFEIQVSQEILSNQKPVEEELVEEENEPVFKLDSTLKTQFWACVLIDYIDGKLQTCNQTANKNIYQLVGTWQIDESRVLEFQSKRIPLEVCMNHFNYDQKNHNAFVKQLRKPDQSEIHNRRCLLCFKNFYFFSREIGCKEHL